MKRFTSALIGLCMLTALTAAKPAISATGNWYLGGSGDLTWLRHSNTGGGGNIDLGYAFNDFRVEGEAGYHGADGDTGFSSTHYFTYMGNAYYDFNTVFSPSARTWHVVPYVGAGLGDAAVHLGGSTIANTFHHHENDFAWQFMGGLNVVQPSGSSPDWFVGYRYLGTSDHNLHANNLELGVRFRF